MSETLGSAYRLAPPDPRAYNNSAMDPHLLALLQGPDSGYNLGLVLGARNRAEGEQRDYAAQLQLSNRMQQEVAGARIAGDEKVAQYGLTKEMLQFPDRVYDYSLSRQLVAPDRLPHSRLTADNAISQDQADIRNTNQHANERGAAAGVLPPVGSGYTLDARPEGPVSQGTPGPQAVAQINADGQKQQNRGFTPANAIALAEHQRKLESDTLAHGERMRQIAIRAALTEKLDINSNTYSPAPISMEQAEAIGEKYAQRQMQLYRERVVGTNSILEQSGVGVRLPTPPAPKERPAVEPGKTAPGATTDRPGAPALGVGGPTGDNGGGPASQSVRPRGVTTPGTTTAPTTTPDDPSGLNSDLAAIGYDQTAAAAAQTKIKSELARRGLTNAKTRINGNGTWSFMHPQTGEIVTLPLR